MTKRAKINQAKELITMYKDETDYFNGTLSESDMYEMLRYRIRFGEAETQVIISALIVSGAKFKD